MTIHYICLFLSVFDNSLFNQSFQLVLVLKTKLTGGETLWLEFYITIDVQLSYLLMYNIYYTMYKLKYEPIILINITICLCTRTV